MEMAGLNSSSRKELRCKVSSVRKNDISLSKRLVRKALGLNTSVSASRSLIRRSSLGANNKALARALQNAKQENRMLKMENQSLKQKLLTLACDDGIELEVQKRFENRMQSTRKYLNTIVSQLLSTVNLLGEALETTSSRNSSIGFSEARLSGTANTRTSPENVTPASRFPANMSNLSSNLSLIVEGAREFEDMDTEEQFPVAGTEHPEQKRKGSNLRRRFPKKMCAEVEVVPPVDRMEVEGDVNLTYTQQRAIRPLPNKKTKIVASGINLLSEKELTSPPREENTVEAMEVEIPSFKRQGSSGDPSKPDQKKAKHGTAENRKHVRRHTYTLPNPFKSSRKILHEPKPTETVVSGMTTGQDRSLEDKAGRDDAIDTATVRDAKGRRGKFSVDNVKDNEQSANNIKEVDKDSSEGVVIEEDDDRSEMGRSRNAIVSRDLDYDEVLAMHTYRPLISRPGCGQARKKKTVVETNASDGVAADTEGVQEDKFIDEEDDGILIDPSFEDQGISEEKEAEPTQEMDKSLTRNESFQYGANMTMDEDPTVIMEMDMDFTEVLNFPIILSQGNAQPVGAMARGGGVSLNTENSAEKRKWSVEEDSGSNSNERSSAREKSQEKTNSENMSVFDSSVNESAHLAQKSTSSKFRKQMADSLSANDDVEVDRQPQKKSATDERNEAANKPKSKSRGRVRRTQILIKGSDSEDALPGVHVVAGGKKGPVVSKPQRRKSARIQVQNDTPDSEREESSPTFKEDTAPKPQEMVKRKLTGILCNFMGDKESPTTKKKRQKKRVTIASPLRLDTGTEGDDVITQKLPPLFGQDDDDSLAIPETPVAVRNLPTSRLCDPQQEQTQSPSHSDDNRPTNKSKIVQGKTASELVEMYDNANVDSHAKDTGTGRRSRRAAVGICYTEPKIGSKLRQGDKHTRFLYNDTENEEPVTAKSKKGRSRSRGSKTSKKM